MTSHSELTVTVPVAGNNQTVIDILHDQYGCLDSGEARAALEAYYTVENVWNNDDITTAFEVSHFEPPYIHVIRKVDGKRGTLLFLDEPRFYFSFNAESNTDEPRTA